MGKEEPTGSGSDMDYITVQRLSWNVGGRYQKYARIGALTMVPLGCEPTISNIKEACKRFFKADDMDCEILAGERGPSWTETSQISNWKKALHVRFIERSEESQMCEKVEIKKTTISEVTPEKPALLTSTRVVASVPLSAMLKQPTVDIVSVQLEEFDLGEKSWRNPFEARLSLSKEKFASGSFRDAYLSAALSELAPGKYFLKKFKQDQVPEIERLFCRWKLTLEKWCKWTRLQETLLKSLLQKPQSSMGLTSITPKFTLESSMGSASQSRSTWRGPSISMSTTMAMCVETFSHYTYVTWLAQLVERQSAVREVEGSCPRPDEHSGS